MKKVMLVLCILLILVFMASLCMASEDLLLDARLGSAEKDKMEQAGVKTQYSLTVKTGDGWTQGNIKYNSDDVVYSLTGKKSGDLTTNTATFSKQVKKELKVGISYSEVKNKTEIENNWGATGDLSASYFQFGVAAPLGPANTCQYSVGFRKKVGAEKGDDIVASVAMKSNKRPTTNVVWPYSNRLTLGYKIDTDVKETEYSTTWKNACVGQPLDLIIAYTRKADLSGNTLVVGATYRL